jgi:glutamine amidotransferase
MAESSSITIVDYGVGNLASVVNMFSRLGVKAILGRTPDDIARADKLLLPGVGAFDHAMVRLRSSGLLEPLEHRVLSDGVPVLGICLGFQLLSRRSDEGREPGLGWIDAETVRFDTSRLESHDRVPHMAWAEIERERPSPLFADMEPEPRFYFVHSYHVRCADPRTVIARAYHGYAFDAAVESGNVLGVQFHPEKSHRFGMRLLKNFVENY